VEVWLLVGYVVRRLVHWFVLVGKGLMCGLADKLIFCDESIVHIGVAMKNIKQISIFAFI